MNLSSHGCEKSNLMMEVEIFSPAKSDENGADPPCAICLQAEVYDTNEIIFCDKCNVAVHQRCYDVAEIPLGPW